MNARKFIAFVLSILMLLGTFVACAQTPADSAETTPSPAGTTAPAVPTAQPNPKPPKAFMMRMVFSRALSRTNLISAMKPSPFFGGTTLNSLNFSLKTQTVRLSTMLSSSVTPMLKKRWA